MILDIRPPDSAGPLRIGSTGANTVDLLHQLGEPQILCGPAGSRPGWGVQRPSGMAISTSFDAKDRVEAIELTRPITPDDEVLYGSYNLFTTPVTALLEALRAVTPVLEQARGVAFLAPALFLSFWKYPRDDDDPPSAFFDNALIATPAYFALRVEVAERV